MELRKKLQVPPGTPVFIVNAPQGFSLDPPTAGIAAGAPLLAFATDSRGLKETCKPAIEAAREGRIAWIAYPKAAKLGTDLNRDRLRESMKGSGIEGVRLVSLDETWSAMRFRPTRR
jgi:hypothetical protein